MSTEYDIDYSDERFTEVETEKSSALSDTYKTYDQMITDSDKYYKQQASAVKDYGNTQSKLQQDKTDLVVEQINQQKSDAKKSYQKEQSAAYVDYQKQIDPYGVDAERLASAGLTNTGYAESLKSRAYITYQNRVASARDVYSNAVLNYDNAIKEAQLQNNSLLAEIAYNTLQQTIELSLNGLQYKNSLITEKAAVKRELEQFYYQQRQDVLNQINTENSLAESIRQFNEQMELQREQLEAYGSYGSGGGSYYSSGGGYSSGYGSYYDDYDYGGGYDLGYDDYYYDDGGDDDRISSNLAHDIIDLGKGPLSEGAVKEMVATGQAHVNPISGRLESGPEYKPTTSTEQLINKALGSYLR